MRTSTAILTALLTFFAGIFVGFLLSPVKRGIGNNCGNTTTAYYGGGKDGNDANHDDATAF